MTDLFSSYLTSIKYLKELCILVYVNSEHNTVLDLKLTIWISTKKFNITLIHLTENSIMEDVVAEYLPIFRKPMIM